MKDNYQDIRDYVWFARDTVYQSVYKCTNWIQAQQKERMNIQMYVRKVKTSFQHSVYAKKKDWTTKYTSQCRKALPKCVQHSINLIKIWINKEYPTLISKLKNPSPSITMMHFFPIKALLSKMPRELWSKKYISICTYTHNQTQTNAHYLSSSLRNIYICKIANKLQTIRKFINIEMF